MAFLRRTLAGRQRAVLVLRQWEELSESGPAGWRSGTICRIRSMTKPATAYQRDEATGEVVVEDGTDGYWSRPSAFESGSTTDRGAEDGRVRRFVLRSAGCVIR